MLLNLLCTFVLLVWCNSTNSMGKYWNFIFSMFNVHNALPKIYVMIFMNYFTRFISPKCKWPYILIHAYLKLNSTFQNTVNVTQFFVRPLKNLQNLIYKKRYHHSLHVNNDKMIQTYISKFLIFSSDSLHIPHNIWFLLVS